MSPTVSATPYSFRRRVIGRAASPPTWACYEQIQYDDESNSGSDSCSDDDQDHSSPIDDDVSDDEDDERLNHSDAPDVDNMDMDMDVDDQGGGARTTSPVVDLKGKQRAIEPEPEPEPIQKRSRKKSRQPQVYTLRPILTIHRSQGFVWNQDLFVPPYIKDRYVASTSPPNAHGFISTSASSTTSALNDYEVEVVEIRVREDEIDAIIP